MHAMGERLHKREERKLHSLATWFAAASRSRIWWLMGMRIVLASTACVLAVARTHRSCAPLFSLFGLCGDGWLDRCGTVLHCYLFKVGVGPLPQGYTVYRPVYI